MSQNSNRFTEALGKEDYEMLSSFRYALRRFLKFSEQAAASKGLTPRQHQALLAIKGYPGRDYVTNGELAERLQIHHQSAVGLVNRLQRMGLVERVAATDDRRKSYIRLTHQGADILEQLTAAHKRELMTIAPHLELLLRHLQKSQDSPSRHAEVEVPARWDGQSSEDMPIKQE